MAVMGVSVKAAPVLGESGMPDKAGVKARNCILNRLWCGFQKGTKMLSAPATILSAAVTILAVLVMVYTFVLVGRMRGRHGIKAPAMSGHPEVERALRVQGNTLEQVVIFLPLLWVATLYFHTIGWLPAALGLVWCIGRMVYATGYMTAAEKRELGFMITALASLGLLILSVWGVVGAWMATTAV